MIGTSTPGAVRPDGVLQSSAAQLAAMFAAAIYELSIEIGASRQSRVSKRKGIAASARR